MEGHGASVCVVVRCARFCCGYFRCSSHPVAHTYTILNTDVHTSIHARTHPQRHAQTHTSARQFCKCPTCPTPDQPLRPVESQVTFYPWPMIWVLIHGHFGPWHPVWGLALNHMLSISCGKSCWYQDTYCPWPVVFVSVSGQNFATTYGMSYGIRPRLVHDLWYAHVYACIRICICICVCICVCSLWIWVLSCVCVCACVRTWRHENDILFTWNQWGPRGLLHKSVDFHYIQTTRDQENIKAEDKTNNSARETIKRAHIARGTHKWKRTRKKENEE